MSQNTTNVVNLTSESFPRETARGLAIVDFWASWCPPCRVLAPTIEELASDLAGSALVAKVDVDAAPELAGRFEVQSIPTVLFLKDGKEVGRSVGAVPKAVLLQKLDSLRDAA